IGAAPGFRPGPADLGGSIGEAAAAPGPDTEKAGGLPRPAFPHYGGSRGAMPAPAPDPMAPVHTPRRPFRTAVRILPADRRDTACQQPGDGAGSPARWKRPGCASVARPATAARGQPGPVQATAMASGHPPPRVWRVEGEEGVAK